MSTFLKVQIRAVAVYILLAMPLCADEEVYHDFTDTKGRIVTGELID